MDFLRWFMDFRRCRCDWSHEWTSDPVEGWTIRCWYKSGPGAASKGKFLPDKGHPTKWSITRCSPRIISYQRYILSNGIQRSRDCCSFWCSCNLFLIQALGRCHTDRSQYSGPWTHTPTRFSNQYFTLLLNIEWKEKVYPKTYKPEMGRTKTIRRSRGWIDDVALWYGLDLGSRI